jgi:hypothetical protein
VPFGSGAYLEDWGSLRGMKLLQSTNLNLPSQPKRLLTPFFSQPKRLLTPFFSHYFLCSQAAIS